MRPERADTGGLRRGLHGVGTVGEQHEEAEVVEQRDHREGEERRMPQRGKACHERRPVRACGGTLGRAELRRLEQHENRKQGDGHEGSGAEERTPPRDRAERAADKRPHRHPDAERRLVEHDRLTRAARSGTHDRGERGRDEERVAEPPARAKADDLRDGAGGTGERRERDDQDEAEHEGPPHAEAARHPAREEHRDARNKEVARKEQHGLAGRGPELFADRGQNRVDEANAHE